MGLTMKKLLCNQEIARKLEENIKRKGNKGIMLTGSIIEGRKRKSYRKY